MFRVPCRLFTSKNEHNLHSFNFNNINLHAWWIKTSLFLVHLSFCIPPTALGIGFQMSLVLNSALEQSNKILFHFLPLVFFFLDTLNNVLFIYLLRHCYVIKSKRITNQSATNSPQNVQNKKNEFPSPHCSELFDETYPKLKDTYNQQKVKVWTDPACVVAISSPLSSSEHEFDLHPTVSPYPVRSVSVYAMR